MVGRPWGCATGNMVLVVWTNFWYKPGSPSFGTKMVVMIEAIERSEGFDKPFWETTFGTNPVVQVLVQKR